MERPFAKANSCAARLLGALLSTAVTLAQANDTASGGGTEAAAGAPAATAAPAAAVPAPPFARLEIDAGAAANLRTAATGSLEVETVPFISGFVALRGGLSWVAASSFRGENRSQLGVSTQVAVSWWRFELATGPLLLQHSDAYNSGTINIASSLDLVLTRHWRLRVEHWSNADSGFPNIGRNRILVGYRF